MRSLMICNPHPKFSGDKIEKNVMGGSCSAIEGVLYRFLVRIPEGGRHLGETGVDGRIILRSVFRKWNVGYGLDRGDSR
jgi:hypothetical protein